MDNPQQQLLVGRRGMLRGAIAAGLGLAGGAIGSCARAPVEMPRQFIPITAPPRLAVPALRFVHLTDMHVGADGPGEEGYGQTLPRALAIDPPPAFAVSGGDHIHCSLYCSRRQAERQWDAYGRAARQCAIPIYSILGNHDVWGWGRGDLSECESNYGKALAMDRLGLTQRYYSFDAGGWHLVFLDNIARRPGSTPYYGDLDAPQLRWLEQDLRGAGGRPVCLFTHIPLLSACVFFDGNDRVRGDFWHVPDAWMHHNVKPLLSLLASHNVRLAISGHIHMLDRVEYLGITFICDGSVCGYYWKGPYQECREGFGVIDLWPDGSFRHQYVASGYQASDAMLQAG